MRKNTSKEFITLLKTEKSSFIKVILCSVLCIAFSIAIPFITAIVIDALITQGKTHSINLLDSSITIPVISIIVLSFISYGFSLIQEKLMAELSEQVTFNIRKQMIHKVSKLPIKYFDQNQVGDFMNRFSIDLNRVSNALVTSLSQLFSAIATVVFAGIMLFYFNIKISFLILIIIIVSFIFTKYIANKNMVMTEKNIGKLGHINTIAEEYFTGNIEIKAFNQESNAIKTMEKLNDEHSQLFMQSQFLNYSIYPITRFLTQIAFIVSAIFGARLALSGAMTVGVLQAYLQYVNYISTPITQISYIINGLQSAMGAFNRALQLLDETEELEDNPKSIVITKTKGNIDFNHVRFGYSKNKVLMNDVSFTAKSGNMIAIVGPTGAGKTTLVNLLMRFYDLDSGVIQLDGIETDTITKSSLRKMFGMVLQDSWLFTGTIAENISYGKKDATREEIIEASKKAQADHFISTLPNGYDTIISNDEELLSQGQKQLLTIARVFLSNPSIVILDEATSSVDTRTELKIQQAIKEVLVNRTSFVIAHRLSTIINADLILVMKDGDIIEQGSHKELLSSPTFYSQLYNSQFQD